MCAVLLFKGQSRTTHGLLKNSAISNFDFGQRDCFDFAGSFLPFPFYKVSSFIFSWLVSKLRPIWGKQDNEKGNVVIMANR